MGGLQLGEDVGDVASSGVCPHFCVNREVRAGAMTGWFKGYPYLVKDAETGWIFALELKPGHCASIVRKIN